MKALGELEQQLSKRVVGLQDMKRKGMKIVGFLPGEFVPEELIYASGAVPICLIYGGMPEPVEIASFAASRVLCPFSKTPIGMYAQEHPYYRLLDLIVVPISCNHMRRVADMWHYFTDTEVFYLGVPREHGAVHSTEYYAETVLLFKDRLERLTGKRIEDGNLRSAILLYNEIRSHLKEISLSRRAAPASVKGSEFVRLNHLSYLCDPKSTLDILTNRMDTIEKVNGKEVSTRARLLLAGPNIALGDTKVISILERHGGSIVIEEICEGMRFYWENVAVDGDLFGNIIDRYFNKRIPCAFQGGSTTRRMEFLQKLASDFNIDGVIWYELRYCETYNLEFYCVEKLFAEFGIPVLRIESEYNPSDVAQISTRVEAFFEMLGEGPKDV